MNNKLIIIGAGEFGKVIADAAFKQNRYKIIGFADDAWPVNTVLDDGLPVICKTNDIDIISKNADFYIVAFEHNKEREYMFKKYIRCLKAAIVVHPSAVVSLNTSIGEGAIILANSVIGVNVKLGVNVIVNAMTLIDHDSVIGSHSHISPGTIIGNNIEIKAHRTTLLGETISNQSYNK